MLATQWLAPSTNSARLVLAHGFTQNARCWGEFGAACTEKFDVLAVDAPGHGRSGHADATLTEAGNLIVEVGERAHYVGYSMGGRMLLHAVLNNPPDIESLVLIGATAGIDSQAERSQRQMVDRERADYIMEVGTTSFVHEWLQQPMFAGLTNEQSAETFRYENSAEGLAASLRNCGAGSQQPLWDQLETLTIPVLVIAGTQDEKYTAIGRRMVEAIGPNARFVNIEGGHAVHLASPAATAAAIISWCEQLHDT